MGESTMMSKPERRPAEGAENVEVRRFSRQRHGGCSECRFTIEPSASQACAG